MKDFETLLIININNYKFKFPQGYIDDLFSIYSDDDQKLNESYLNNKKPPIKFAIKKIQNLKIPFLVKITVCIQDLQFPSSIMPNKIKIYIFYDPSLGLQMSFLLLILLVKIYLFLVVSLKVCEFKASQQFSSKNLLLNIYRCKVDCVSYELKIRMANNT